MHVTYKNLISCNVRTYTHKKINKNKDEKRNRHLREKCLPVLSVIAKIKKIIIMMMKTKIFLKKEVLSNLEFNIGYKFLFHLA